MALSKIESDSIASTIDLSGISLTLPDGSVTSSKLDTNIAITGNFTVDTDTLYVDSANNRVGIGTASPSSLLHLKSTGPAILTLEADSDNATETDNARIELSQDGGLVTGRIGYASNTNTIELWNNASEHLIFGTNNTERMRINNLGNVGINSVGSTTYKLQVYGGTLGTTSGDALDTLSLYTNTVNGDSLNFYKIRQVDGNGWESAAWRIQQKIDATNMGYIQFNGSGLTQGISLGTANTERMRIDSSGNVGIGTSSATQKLHITDTLSGSVTTPLILNNYDTQIAGTGVELRLCPSIYTGNVGSTARWSSISAINGGSGNPTYLVFKTNSASADPVERMRIDSNGNVLVGTTTARGTITVNGSVSPVAAPSSIWGIDFGTSTSNGNYITIANNATYALSGGAGCVWIYEQSSSVGLCMVNFAYGGAYIVSNPQNNYSNTVNTASKTNIYYDPGIGKYTIQNKMGTTYSYWIATMKIRATS